MIKIRMDKSLLLSLLFLVSVNSVFAQDSTAKTSGPSLEQRIASVEAYISNGNPSPDGIATPSTGIPGPLCWAEFPVQRDRNVEAALYGPALPPTTAPAGGTAEHRWYLLSEVERTL